MGLSEINKKIIAKGKYEEVIEINDHFYIVPKKQQIAVLPYTIDTKGLLDKVGVIKDYNYILNAYNYTLICGYINKDDETNLVAANRILFEIIKTNVTNANKWMYLGNIFNGLMSDSPIDLYCVDITDIKIPETKEVVEIINNKKFELLDSSYVVTSDDMLLLSSFLRLFNYFYVSSLEKYKK